MKIFISTCTDVFGGYGLTSTGLTRKESEQAMFRIYDEVSKVWNDGDSWCKSLKELQDEWGVLTLEIEVGKGYFGDHDETDILLNV